MFSAHIDPSVIDLAVGVVVGRSLTLAPSSDEQRVWSTAIVQRVLANGTSGGDSRREAVRRMLRHGGFKPAGRNKPAQEYLLRTATEASELPAILNAVDALNAVSLESGLPISLLSMARLGEQFMLRYGAPGEKFVFNRAGQELDLEGLVCTCAGSVEPSTPLGTPIKDSMLGKVTESDRDVVAVVYASKSALSDMDLLNWAGMLATAFDRWCGAADVKTLVID